MRLDDFRVIVVDTEYTPHRGELPEVICLVAKDLRTGQVWRVWRDECRTRRTPPYPSGPDVIMVAYSAEAELLAYRAIGWAAPTRVVDLMAEYRCVSNEDLGKNERVPPYGLSDALHTFDLLDLLSVDKAAWQERCATGVIEDTEADREGLLNYCLQDVLAAEGLWRALLPTLELSRALWRGESYCQELWIEGDQAAAFLRVFCGSI